MQMAHVPSINFIPYDAYVLARYTCIRGPSSGRVAMSYAGIGNAMTAGATSSPAPQAFRVLSLDGGGMRGLYTAKLLEHLSRKFDDDRAKNPKDLDVGRAFDLIVGTSTGGILACALAAGLPPRRIVEFYREYGPKIFRNPIPRGWGGLVRFALFHLFGPANSGAALRGGLVEMFGTETIGELYERRQIRVCIPTVNLDRHMPMVIKTGHLPSKRRDDAVTLVDACLATSAAPIILPLVQFDMDDGLKTATDGGLWANSPIMIGLIEALAVCDGRDIEILSVGTCPPPVGKFAGKGKTAWGLLRWRFGVGIIETSIDVQAAAAGFAFAQIRDHLKVRAQLARLDQTAPSQDHQRLIGLDRADADAMDALERFGVDDAELAHSQMTSNPPRFPFVRDIFMSLPRAEPVNKA
jgi:hypothetical protein